jgi:hypothetical protein
MIAVSRQTAASVAFVSHHFLLIVANPVRGRIAKFDILTVKDGVAQVFGNIGGHTAILTCILHWHSPFTLRKTSLLMASARRGWTPTFKKPNRNKHSRDAFEAWSSTSGRKSMGTLGGVLAVVNKSRDRKKADADKDAFAPHHFFMQWWDGRAFDDGIKCFTLRVPVVVSTQPAAPHSKSS